MARLYWTFLMAVVLAGSAESCVYLYGSRHGAAQAGIHFSYGYNGLDWPEEDTTWTCSGAHQSPISVPSHSALSRLNDAEASIFNFGKLTSNGSNILVKNNGHTVVVNLPASYKPEASVVYRGDAASATLTSKFNSSATAAAARVKINPDQFHFHTRSEHVIGGKEYPLELHIVNKVLNDVLPACGAGGCLTVVGIMFELDQSDTATNNSFLETVFSVMPLNEGNNVTLTNGTTLDFDAVLPADRSYITYEGSLTTPPCTEGILWHVLTTPVKITKKQLNKFQLAVGETECLNTTAIHTTQAQGGASGTRNAEMLSQFEVPELTEDPGDHQMCHKLSGHNYREVQDTKERPILFYAAPGVCDAQLQRLAGSSQVVRELLYPSGNNQSMSLDQYHDIVDANMTKAAGCAGMAANSAELRSGATAWLKHVLLGAAAMAVGFVM